MEERRIPGASSDGHAADTGAREGENQTGYLGEEASGQANQAAGRADREKQRGTGEAEGGRGVNISVT